MPDENGKLLSLSPLFGWQRPHRPSGTAKKILYDTKSFASVLLAALVDLYGLEAVSWSPTGVREQIFLDFGRALPDIQLNRLFAAISILTSNDFYKRLPRFLVLCNLLEGNISQPDDFYPADCLTMAWGITEAALIDPPDDSLEYVFSEAIGRYVRVMLDAEKIVDPPAALRWVAGQKWKPDFRAFSGMPPLFQAEYEAARGRGEEIDLVIQQRLHIWALQMQAIVPIEELAKTYS